jgi:hypothetical protein
VAFELERIRSCQQPNESTWTLSCRKWSRSRCRPCRSRCLAQIHARQAV